MRVAFVVAVVGLAFFTNGSGRAQTWTSTSTGGATALWGTDTNWTPNTVPNAVGASATVNAPTATRTIEVDGEFTVGNVTFDCVAPGGGFTQSIRNNDNIGDTLKFDAVDAGPATIVASGDATTSSRIQTDMYFEDSVVANVSNIVGNATAGALSLTGNMAGPGGLTKTGDGMLTLAFNAGSSAQVKAYLGATVVSGGRLRMSVGGTPTSTSSFTINAGGQLALQGSTGGTYNIGGGTAPLNLNGFGATSGPFAAFPGAIRPDTDNDSVFANPVELQSDASIALFGTGTTMTLNGAITGGSDATLHLDAFSGQPTNQGTLIVTNSNTYSGGTSVIQGTFRLSGAAATVGLGDVFVDGVSDRGNGVLGSGKLEIEAGVLDGIADTALVTLTGGSFGGTAILGAGVDELIGGLVLGGVAQTNAGTYGSTASGADFPFDAYFTGNGVLRIGASAGQPGDHNEDGFVDVADYVAWRKLPDQFGDDPGGYDEFYENFGEGGTGGGGSAGVPEPGGLLLIAGLAPFAIACRRSRRVPC